MKPKCYDRILKSLPPKYTFSYGENWICILKYNDMCTSTEIKLEHIPERSLEHIPEGRREYVMCKKTVISYGFKYVCYSQEYYPGSLEYIAYLKLSLGNPIKLSELDFEGNFAKK